MILQHCWVKNNRAVGQVVIARTAGAVEIHAAEELSRYFEKISGAPLPVIQGVSNRTAPSIIILDASRPANREFLAKMPVASLRHDGFFIRSDGADLFIGANEPSGLVFGVYQYLTLVLNVRFFDLGLEGEEIPYLDTVEHAAVNILKNPRLPYRGLQQPVDIQRLDWMIKNGFNYARYYFPPNSLEWWDQNGADLTRELKKRGIRLAFAHHIFDFLIPENKYLDDNPEYFPIVNGKRSRQHQFSWSLQNPAVTAEVIRVLEDFLGRHPEIDMLDFWPADGIYKVNADDYRAITGGDTPQPGSWEQQAHGRSPTGRLGDPNKAKIYALLIKPVAEALGRRFPALVISTLHYIDLTQPCPDVRLPDNVAPAPAMYWRCIKHTLLDERCPYNRQFKQILSEWTRMYPDRLIFLYEYYMGMGCHASLPYPCLTSLFAEWDELIRMGIGGAHIQSSDRHVPYAINYLAFAALAWNDPPTLDEFLRDYCQGYFGEAAEAVYRMYRLWEEGVHQAEDTQPGIGFFAQMFSPERVQQCRDLLDNAMRDARDPKVIYRLARLIILTEYTRQALTCGKEQVELAFAQRRGEDLTRMERQLLKLLPPIAQYYRRLSELGRDICPRLTADQEAARDSRNIWSKKLGQLRKQPWALNAFDADAGEAELRRHGARRGGA